MAQLASTPPARSLAGALLVALLAGPFAAAAQHLARGGLLVVELDSVPAVPQWRSRIEAGGYTGAAYVYYDGPDLFGAPGRYVHRYRVALDSPGTYRFQWRSRIARGTSNTEHNDSWLRITGAREFYARRGGGAARLYPRGSGRTPNPEGNGGDGYFKVYQNRRNEWTWQTATSDNDPHEIYVDVGADATLTVEIAGRSNGHALDRFVLYHSSVPPAQALDERQPASPILSSVYTPASRAFAKTPYPNPAADQLHLSLPPDFSGQACEIELIDSTGRTLRSDQARVDAGGQLRLDIGELPRGSYTVRVHAGTVTFAAPWVKA